MTVAAVLTYVLAQVYRTTHRGTSYSQTYIHTLFMMSVATAVIMMIIGSNIARAFSLVGALSIIRFRTAVKDARDTGYLFAAVVIGMGCGTQFYMPAIGFTAFISALMIGAHLVEFGRKLTPDNIIRVTFRKSDETQTFVDGELKQAFKLPRLLNRLVDLEEDCQTNVYAVRVTDREAISRFESRLKERDDVLQVGLYERDQHEGDA
jgi:uncharacterized membrane protein YhiD involved in acid resistance